MIQATEIAFIGHPVTDVARARDFYERILGLVPAMAHEFKPGVWWVEYELAGVAIALTNAWPPSGTAGATLAIEVADYEAAEEKIKAAGLAMDYAPQDTPVCRFFGIKDPDGNSITIHKRKPGNG
jgi:predicted enzyme related to lactoylglutathione lyase